MEDSKPEIKGMFDLIKKSFGISLNYVLDFIPFPLTIILFKILDKSDSQEILGLTITFFNFGFGHLVGIQDVIGIRCSKEFGKKDGKTFWNKFFVFIFLDLVLLLFSILFVVFSKEILIFSKIKIEIINDLNPFLKGLLFGKIMENFNLLLKGVLIAQKTSEIFFLTNFINLAIFTISIIITLFYYNLNLNGFIISFSIKVVFEFIILLLILIKTNKIKFIPPKFSTIFSELWKDIKYTIYILIGYYGEWISFEVLAYYATLSGKIENINSWYFYVIINFYCFFSSQGISATLRTYSSIAIGERNPEKFKKTWKKIFFYGLFLVLMITSVVSFFAEEFASIFTKDEKTLSILTSLIRLYIIIRPFEWAYSSFACLLIVIKKESLQFIISAFILPGLTILLGYVFTVVLEYENIGLFFSWFCSGVPISFLLTGCYLYNEKIFLKNLMEKKDIENEFVSLENY